MNGNDNIVKTSYAVEQRSEHNRSSFLKQQRQSQFQNQQKCLQNYLNQSFKASEKAVQSSSHHLLDEDQQNLGSNKLLKSQHRRGSHNQSQEQRHVNNQSYNHQTAFNQRSNSASRLNHNTSALSVLGVNDKRRNDPQYACLQVKKAEFFCTKDNLVKQSHYLMRVFDKQEFSTDLKERNAQVKIKLPESTKVDVLIMFLDYIDKGKELPNKIDLYIAQNILLIAEALKMRQIQRKFLFDILMPMLNRENVIFFTKMAYNKLSAGKNEEHVVLQDDLESQTSHVEEEEFWFDFFTYALDLAAQYIHYLIKRKSAELLSVLEPSIVEEIIERAIRFYRADLQYDNSHLFDTLLKVRKCDSIFQLLDQERIKIIENEDSLINAPGGVRPMITWNIQNLTGNFYRESDPFLVENAQWKLSISYFKMEEEALSVQIKMVNNPFEVKKSKDYFKKKEFFLASNVAGGMQNQVNPLEEALNEEGMTQDQINRKRKEIEQANSEYPSHAFITIVSSVRINPADRLSNPLVHTLICSAKTPALLKKFCDFKIDDYQGSITAEIYFKVKYIYSAILLYISKNFTYLICDPLISMMPKDQLKLILKHKQLHVTQEDEVIKAICMWSEGQDTRLNMDQDLIELLENVNWNYISLQCILDLIRNFPYVRRNPTFHKIVNKEFAMRNKFNPETTNLDPPRFSYKYNKAQTNGGVNKNSKNAKALLFVNHENFFQNLLDSMLEPVDIIKAHLINEGINESSHKKHLELQLLQKKRELIQIEEQLYNMKLMDEINRANNCNNSRPNSRLKHSMTRPSPTPNSQNNQRYLNNTSGIGNQRGHQHSEMGIADDVETVKNSMINLLNVVIENEGGERSRDNVSSGKQQQMVKIQQSQLQQQIRQSNKQHNLIELSQEVLQKMQKHQNHHNLQSKPVEVNLDEMYNDLHTIAQNKKIEIIFKSQCNEDDNEEEEEIIYRNNDEGVDTNLNPTEKENYGGATNFEEEDNESEMREGQGYTLDGNQDMLEEESKGQAIIDSSNAHRHLLTHGNPAETESIVIVNEPGGKEIRMKQMQSFTSQSSKIIVGGASLVSPNQLAQLMQIPQNQEVIVRQIPIIMAECKSIQTSLQNIPPQMIEEQQYQYEAQPDYVDQSIQMTFEEPPEDLVKNDSMLKPQQQEDNNPYMMSMSHEASQLSVITNNILGNIQVSNQPLTSQPTSSQVQNSNSSDIQQQQYEDEQQEESEENDNQEEEFQPAPFLSPVHPANMQEAQKIMNQQQYGNQDLILMTPPPQQMALSIDQQQYHFEQLKVKYQKQLMQEYTQLVQKMSQDVFDTNFLKNFLSPGQTGSDNQSMVGVMEGQPAAQFQSPYNTTPSNQVQVQNPKVHNLNISIHNNSNFGGPYALDNQNYTPISQHNMYGNNQTPGQSNQLVPQFSATQFISNTQQSNMKVAQNKNGIKSPPNGQQQIVQNQSKNTPTNGQQNKQQTFKETGSNKKTKQSYQSTYGYDSKDYNKPRPQSGGTNTAQRMIPTQPQHSKGKSATFKKPQNFSHLQIESAESTIRSQTPMTSMQLQQEISSDKHNFAQYGPPQMNSFAANQKQQKAANKGASNLNSPHLANYVNTMPNSVKHSQPIKMYTYQNQQQAHQKVVKASAINKNQNKVILQQILNDNGMMMGTMMSAGGGHKQVGSSYQMTIDPSGDGGATRMMGGSTNTHLKTKSQQPGIFHQWSTAEQQMQQYSANATHTRDKSNEHLQNEIMRLIVEDSSSFQHPQQQQAVIQQHQLWSQTPQANHNTALQGLNQSFNTKRGSQQVPNTGYLANFNILDQIKQQTTPSMQQQKQRPQTAQMNPNFIQQIHNQTPLMNPTVQYMSATEVKPQQFGSLATHHQYQKQMQQSYSGSGNIVSLDLAKLKVVSAQAQYHQRNVGELCTIEESKRSEPLQDSESCYQQVKSHTIDHQPLQNNTNTLLTQHSSLINKPVSSHSGSVQNGSWTAVHVRKASLQQQLNHGSGSSLSYHSLNNNNQVSINNNLNRCQPHEAISDQ